MRKNATQVTVISVTPAERRRGRNLITAPANLLVWLISLASTIPSAILQLKVPSVNGRAENHPLLPDYQYITVVCLSSILPILIIGSSAELRQDINDIKQRYCPACHNATNVYETGSTYGTETHHNAALNFPLYQSRAGIYTIDENTATSPS